VIRVAAVDCGTNSLRLLIADIEGDALTDVVRRLEIVRLGQDVDRTGAFAPAALARAFSVCEEYAQLVAEHRPEALRFCATSAARDVSNTAEFADGVRARLGVEPEIISGPAEARLSYAGAVHDLDLRLLHQPLLVLDIGGGSTEFIEGDGAVANRWESLDIGSVRLTERHLRSNPPTIGEVDAADADVAAAVEALPMDVSRSRSLIGVAGTITTVAAHALDSAGQDARAVHRALLPVEQVLRSCRALIAASVEERRAMPFMHPGRADVIGGGALILQHLLRRLAPTLEQASLLVSEHDILDGIAWSIAER
jgi:exopolyphosphatase/guanosine-5'-triphosphate,3'-diphosphate pyrophosphatase